MKQNLYFLYFALFLFAFSYCTNAQVIITHAGNGSFGYSGDGGPATNALIYSPYGVAADGGGNVYIADWNNSRVRKVDASGIITTCAGTGTFGFSGDGGPATAAKIGNAWSVASDFAGNIFIADYYNSRVRRVDATTGIITTIAGNGTPGYSGDGGPATNAKINTPYGLAVDGSGNVYIADWNNYRVRKVDASGIITTFAGIGTSGFMGDGGPATAAEFRNIWGLGTDLSGNVYISDYGNQRVRVVNSSGIITTFAGTGATGFSGDGGPATAAMLNYTYGICADFSGNVYLGDYLNDRVRKVDPTGIITTFAGNGTYNYSGDGGPATAASFRYPVGVAADGSGNIYIGDYNNYRVRKVNGRNRVPKFINGLSATFTVCGNAIDSVNKLLAIHDSDYYQLEVFTDIVPPSNGTVYLGGRASNGDTMTPKGFYYQPTLGYSGRDSFKVRVFDGYDADTIEIFVNILLAPAVITGTPSMCLGFTTSLSDVTPSGTWTSSTTAVATVGSTGLVTSVTAGTSSISYTLSTGCRAVVTATVNPLPLPIIGVTAVCKGLTTTLSNVGGGTWSSSNTAIAVAGSTGIISGINVGTSVITYTLPTGCITTTTVNVNPLPAAITGTPVVCAGLTTALSDATPGGTWTSGVTITGTVGSSSGIVTGASAGVTNITYTITLTGCIAVLPVTVNPLPGAITGTMSVCAGSTTSLTDAGGGTWTSGNTGIATVGFGTGVVGGVAAGTAAITYTLSTGCIQATTVTVNPLPAAITGASSVCAGLTTPFSDATPGGAWSTSSPSIAGVGSSTGMVSGISSGMSVISYTISGTGCSATKTVTVNPSAGFITGTTKICVGATSALSNAGGGTWTSANTSIASAGYTTGMVTGMGTGTTTITYTLSTGCMASTVVTVYPSPAAITGATGLCVSTTSALSSTTGGGIWSSSSTSVATVSSTGLVSGLAVGMSMITYKIFTTGCMATATVAVSAAPGPITGNTNICIGSVTALSNSAILGTWTSGNTSVATIVLGTGVASGIGAGTAKITYSLGGSCQVMTTLTVNPAISGISGTKVVCENYTTTLSNTTGGGTWVSSTPAIATIGSSSGLVTGVLAGTTTVTYTLASGCNTLTTVTVNPAPSPITGITDICAAGGTVTVSNSTGGGTWSSTTPAIATIGSSAGLVTGVTAGTTLITYKLTSTGCTIGATISVNPLPSPISGIAAVCPSGTTTLTNTGGGTWTSGTTTIATIGLTSGMLNGLIPGTSVITYELSTGCRITKTATVNPLPSAISGPSAVCIAANITLTNTGGGTWTSSTTGIATVGLTSGIVTGGALGSTRITYTLPTGCITTTTVTVSPSPTPINGPSALCVATTVTLSNGVGGGSWASGNTAVATIGSTSGDVSGLLPGTSVITYSLGSGCTVARTITVNPAPAAISGTTTVCVNNTSTLTDATPGGAWSSSNTGVASITSGGVAAGVAAGTATITYSLGCVITTTFSVKPTPTAILGSATVCRGDISLLSDAVTGGVWTSSNPSVATIGSAAGDVTGVTAGTSNIAYTLGGSCSVSKMITVNPSAAITGGTSVCVSMTTSLSNAVPGGTWSTSMGSIASVTGGLVSGIAPGTSVIGYHLPTGCISTLTVTVNTVPTAIIGAPQFCIGTPAALTDGVSGGVWSSSSPSVATIGSTSGMVTGMTSGTSTITYSLGSGCNVFQAVTVNPLPASISASNNVCVGNTGGFSDATPGGTWSLTTTSVILITGPGTFTGVGAGSATLTYTLGTGCYAAKTINIIALPAAISGPTQVCAGYTTTLTSTGTGTWSSSAPAKATAGLSSGIITGMSAGTATITYTAGFGCAVNTTVTVDPVPAAITGSANMCIGWSLTLSDATPGGAWSSSNPAAATVVTGSVSGVGVGTSTISYTLPTGCAATRLVTINALPPAITGTTTVCTGFTTALTDAGTGTWRSSSPAIAAAGMTSGIVSGMTGGTATITYSLGAGCTVTTDVTVNTTPAAIAGTTHACMGQTTVLSDATPAGAWSSTVPSVASIDAAGVVTSVSPGTAMISYTLNGCPVSTMVTINALPAAITGGAQVCAGSATMFSDATAGGTWSSTAPGTAIIGLTSGIATGMSAGLTAIVYTLPTGCSASASLNVDPLPAPVTGPGNVCGTLAIAFSDATAGGAWSSSNPVIASVDAAGLVSGLAGGSATISYTLPTTCLAVKTVTVYPAVQPITGARNMCNGGGTITVSDADAPAGVWTSSLVTVSTGGVVTAFATGAAVITYTLPTGCFTTATLTVNALPGAITGSATGCTGASTVLADTTLGGAWSSSVTAVAVISGTGTLNGLTAGTTVISYMMPSGCGVADTVTIYPSPSAIIGIPQACTGDMTTLTNPTPGGIWSSSAPATATAGAGTGDITGIKAGTATITYTSGVGCIATVPFTVLPLPTVYSVTGGGILCAGEPGVHVLQSSSATGTVYDLYNGSTLAGTMTGTGGPLDFGLITTSGMFTVKATNTLTGCTSNMSGIATVIVNPKVTPDVNIASVPGTTVCEGTPVTFTAVPTFGGSAPLYQWKVNGVNVGTTTTYSYTPTEGDVVIAMMTSNATCATTPAAYAYLTMSVAGPQIPVVTITADPGASIAKGQSITFTATVSNGGASPVYQWTLNGVNIPGANSAAYTTSSLKHNDVIGCNVTADGMCATSAGAQEVRVLVSTTAVAPLTQNSDIKVVPNPSKGAFSIKGNLGTISNGTVAIELTDMIGQVVYRNNITTTDGNISEEVKLASTVASGMYLLSIRSEHGNQVFHIIIEQ